MLKQLRLDRKLSQAQLGKLIGLSDVAICYYEKGKRVPNLPTMKKLANALQVDVQDIINCFIDETEKNKEE